MGIPEGKDWVLGAHFLNFYYTYFSQEYVDTDGLLIGFTEKRNSTMLAEGDVKTYQMNLYSLTGTLVAVISFVVGITLIIILSIYLWWNLRYKKKLKAEKEKLCFVLGRLDEDEVVN